MGKRLVSMALGVAAVAFATTPVRATFKYGPFQVSGNLQAQNVIRHPDVSHYQLIQNRYTARLRFEYDWLERGLAMDKYRVPFIERSKLFLLWRGSYDSIYDTTPGFIEKEDIYGDSYIGRNLFEFAKLKEEQSGVRGFARRQLTLQGLTAGERNTLKFENALREAYLDVKLRGIPLTVRAGRQQIVWGESDNFRMLDRVNTLDTTWHFINEFFWDELRQPFWMLKFLYNIGNMWKLQQTFLEWYWNPGDWRPIKITFLPRPWGARLLNPLDNQIDGAMIGGLCTASPFRVRSGPNKGTGFCRELMNGTRLFQKGDYDRNPLENSQVGVRYHAITPQGVEFTLNYLYQRWGNDDGTPSAPVRGLPNTPENRARASRLLLRGVLPAEYFAPYVHTIGLAGNYSDETYTQAVFRLETVFDFGIPFYDVAKETIIQPLPVLPGITKKEMWKGMLAFDRPTWIRFLNKKSTFFITGQFFWHHIIDWPSCEPQTVAQSPSAAKRRIGSCLIGPFDLPSTVRVGTDPSTATYRDKVREWESIFSLAAFTFYRGGSIFPLVAIVVDPVNHFVTHPILRLDYLVRDDFVINVTQRYFITPRGHRKPMFDAWGLGGLSRGRSETAITFSYQF